MGLYPNHLIEKVDEETAKLLADKHTIIRLDDDYEFLEDSMEMPLRRLLLVLQARIVNQSTYFGLPTQKSPLDFWVYQEIIHETRPDYIVEIGTCYGGSTLALAHLCDNLNHGKVIGIDEHQGQIPDDVCRHPRITLIESDACEGFSQVRKLIPEDASVLVIEDSSHTYENTLAVLRTYSGLIKSGDYFIVEDSIPFRGANELDSYPGPWRAIVSFLQEDDSFEVARYREPFLVTWNPIGYLKKKEM